MATLTHFLFCLSLLLDSGFSSAQTPVTHKPGINAKSASSVTGPMTMSQAELQEVTIKAEHGDAAAANKLGYYYDVGQRDQSKSLHWFKISAQASDPIGQYSYGCVLLRNKTNESVIEALRWLELAQENGVSSAKYCIAEAMHWQLMRDKTLTKNQ
ncbi:tetratricopeptide repeat protein [Undibacterium sp. TC9W]